MFDRHYQNQTDILITKMRPDPRRPKRCKGVINAALEVVHVFPDMRWETRWRSLRGASRDGWQLTVGTVLRSRRPQARATTALDPTQDRLRA
jgi:hypothetical protein